MKDRLFIIAITVLAAIAVWQSIEVFKTLEFEESYTMLVTDTEEGCPCGFSVVRFDYNGSSKVVYRHNDCDNPNKFINYGKGIYRKR